MLAGMAVRSTGTVTFLFTDIEGSSQLRENDRAAMQDALARHDDTDLRNATGRSIAPS
jgi:class 3 adenylate cyclase